MRFWFNLLPSSCKIGLKYGTASFRTFQYRQQHETRRCRRSRVVNCNTNTCCEILLFCFFFFLCGFSDSSREICYAAHSLYRLRTTYNLPNIHQSQSKVEHHFHIRIARKLPTIYSISGKHTSTQMTHQIAQYHYTVRLKQQIEQR